MGCYPSHLTFIFFRGVGIPPTSHVGRSSKIDRWISSIWNPCGLHLGWQPRLRLQGSEVPRGQWQGWPKFWSDRWELTIYCWLVVWSIWIIFPYMGCLKWPLPIWYWWLVGGLEHEIYVSLCFHSVGKVITPTDELIFFRGVQTNHILVFFHAVPQDWLKKMF